MEMNNKVYDTLKWVALIVMPAFGILYKSLAITWSLPFGEQIPETVMALELFLGAVLGVSNATYKKNKKDEVK